MAFWLLGLYALLITPLRIGALFSWKQGAFRCTYGVMIWGAALRGEVLIRRDEGGRLRMTPDLRPRKEKRVRLSGQLKSLGKPSEIRKLVWRLGRLCLLRVRVDVGGQDAAGVALCAGTMRALSALLPRAWLQCRPVFGGKSALSVHCIVEIRLGMLLIAYLLGRHFLAGRKEEKTAWNIPSGT